MTPIHLPILFLSDTDQQLVALGITTDDDCPPEVRQMTFYRIDALSPYYYDDKEYTCIHTASQSFICPKEIGEVEKLIINN